NLSWRRIRLREPAQIDKYLTRWKDHYLKSGGSAGILDRGDTDLELGRFCHVRCFVPTCLGIQFSDLRRHAPSNRTVVGAVYERLESLGCPRLDVLRDVVHRETDRHAL